jgi:hypothetical protein
MVGVESGYCPLGQQESDPRFLGWNDRPVGGQWASLGVIKFVMCRVVMAMGQK